MGCEACAEASGPLLQRQRVLAGLAPWVWAPALLGAMSRRAHQRTAQVTAAGAVAAAVAVAVAVAATVILTGAARSPAPHAAAAAKAAASTLPQSQPTPSAEPVESSAPVTGPRPLPRLTVAGRALSVGPRTSLAAHIGQPVRADQVLVLSVDADEGFWVGTDAAHRVWVQMQSRTESAQTIRPGQRVSFVGTMVGNSAGFASSTGVTPAGGAAQLTDQAAHVAVPARLVTIAR